MKKLAFVLVVALLGVSLGEAARAHGPRSRVHLGLHFGVPIGWYPWYYGPPYYYPYYPPAVVVAPAVPQTYIERGAAEPAPESRAQWWYYCADSRAYYPYVKECPGGWQRVAPQPPGN